MVSWATAPVLWVLEHGHRLSVTHIWKWLRLYVPGTASSPAAHASHSLVLPSFTFAPSAKHMTIDD